MKRFGTCGQRKLESQQKTKTEKVESNTVSECVSSECKHHHENVKLKNLLNSSFEESQKLVLESGNIIKTMQNEYENQIDIYKAETSLLKEEIKILQDKLHSANELGNEKLDNLNKELDRVELSLENSDKEKQKKVDVFQRLYQSGNKNSVPQRSRPKEKD